jgi:hypothetical protein
MSKDDPKESHERERAALAIDPKLGHGDVVTRGKLQQALDRPEAVAALRAAAGSSVTDTANVGSPRKPTFLNTEEYHLARKLVGAASASTPPTEEDSTTVVSKRAERTVGGNTQRLLPGNDDRDPPTAPDSPDARVELERHLADALPPPEGGRVGEGGAPQPDVLSDREKVVAAGAEPLLVAGERARRLPSGDPTAATLEARLTPEKLAELGEKAQLYVQANVVGLDVPPEERQARVAMMEQLVLARQHESASKTPANPDDAEPTRSEDRFAVSDTPIEAVTEDNHSLPPKGGASGRGARSRLRLGSWLGPALGAVLVAVLWLALRSGSPPIDNPALQPPPSGVVPAAPTTAATDPSVSPTTSTTAAEPASASAVPVPPSAHLSSKPPSPPISAAPRPTADVAPPVSVPKPAPPPPAPSASSPWGEFKP